MPVAFDLVPGVRHDPTPVHELCYSPPAGADEATILSETGVRLVPIRKATVRPNDRAHSKRIEALYFRLEAMGVQRLRARTNPGLELKPHVLLLAVAIINAD